jgi:hypothetical protein
LDTNNGVHVVGSGEVVAHCRGKHEEGLVEDDMLGDQPAVGVEIEAPIPPCD